MQQKTLKFKKDLQYYKFCLYGFLKNLRFFEPFLVLFFLENNLSFLQIGFLYSVREIGRNLLEIPAGIISDSLGRKRTMIASFSLYIFSFSVFFYSYSYAGFIWGMIFYSLGDAFRTGTHKAMIFDYLSIKGWQDQKVHYYGHTRSFSQLGSAVSVLIAASLVFFTGSIRMIFLFSVIPCLLDLLLIISYPKSLNGTTLQFSSGHFRKNIREVLSGFAAAIKQKQVLKAISNLSLHTGYYRAIKDYLQPVLNTLALSLPFFLALSDQKRSSLLIGLVYFVIFLCTSFAARNAGKFAGKFRNIRIPMNITLLAGLISGVICGLFFSGGILIASVIFFILIYIIENLRKPTGVAYVAESIDKKVLASALSVESQAHSLIGAGLAPVIGYFADLAGIGIAILIVSVVIFLMVPFVIARK